MYADGFVKSSCQFMAQALISSLLWNSTVIKVIIIISQVVTVTDAL